MNLIGDVAGRCAVMVDDMIDTAGTLLAGAELLRAKGARAVYACASHAVLSGPAVSRLNCDLFTEVIVTNSIPQARRRRVARMGWPGGCHQSLHKCLTNAAAARTTQPRRRRTSCSRS